MNILGSSNLNVDMKYVDGSSIAWLIKSANSFEKQLSTQGFVFLVNSYDEVRAKIVLHSFVPIAVASFSVQNYLLLTDAYCDLLVNKM